MAALGELVRTLDEVERTLSAKMGVVADACQALGRPLKCLACLIAREIGSVVQGDGCSLRVPSGLYSDG